MSSKRKGRGSAQPAPALAPTSAPAPAPVPRRRPWALLGLALASVAVLLVVLLGAGGRVLFDQDVELTSVDVPREALPGDKATVTVHLHARHALGTSDQIFVHVESEPGDDFRTSVDQTPTPPSTRWAEQDIVVPVIVPIASSARPGRHRVFVGLYDPLTGDRLHLLEPREPDNRVLGASIDLVAEDADGSTRTFGEPEIHAQTARAPFAPLLPWLAAVLVAAGVAAWLRMRQRPSATQVVEADEAPVDASERWLRRAWLLLPVTPFFLGILVVLEFVKDDAYISFRYTHNLVTGQGLVFNHGERVEGFTNFLWVFVLAPFEALGWDLFQVCEVLAVVLGVATLVITARMTAWVNGRRSGSFLWGAMWLATSSSYVLWAKSGLEQPLAALLPIAGALLLWPARSQPKPERRMLAAGLVLGAACMTRPELHAMAILVGLPLVVDAVRARKITRAQLLYVAGILVVTVPCHAFRYAYYGTLLPNTFYAKTSTSSVVWRGGLGSLHELLVFNATGVLAVLAPLALAGGRRTVETATMAVIAAAFMGYLVLVGVDEMQWSRLYLPALPFLCVLAALGLQNLLEGVLRGVERARRKSGPVPPRARLAAYVLGWVAVLTAAGNSFAFTYREVNGFNGHGDLAGTFHPDLGKFLVRHERPGGLVAFQDMGSTPYHAPDLDFLDFVGLVDRTVARARHDLGLHAFMNADTGGAQGRFEAQMREYFFDRAPEWTILTIYTPKGDEAKAAREFDEDPTGGAFGDMYRANAYQWGLWDDARFRARYVPVRTWPRSSAYYLALWRRRDLWDQKPREVVLDAPPAGLVGVKAKLEGGLELLGSETTAQAPERHEAFVTTWWKLPGPMPRDLYFFVHLTRSGFQLPSDHVPGDWMYPADRWQAGETLEDRTLLQLPPFTVTPGTYDIYLGAYRRSTGQRLAVIEGPHDEDNRIHLGTLVVTPLRPFIDQLIPPTHLASMREHPERIVDSHRAR
jgi:arabinofuranosyltransferase